MMISLHTRTMVKSFILESSCLIGSHQRPSVKVAMCP